MEKLITGLLVCPWNEHGMLEAKETHDADVARYHPG
jgi:hypothetical protein